MDPPIASSESCHQHTPVSKRLKGLPLKNAFEQRTGILQGKWRFSLFSNGKGGYSADLADLLGSILKTS
jgi:hypothetical protein